VYTTFHRVPAPQHDAIDPMQQLSHALNDAIIWEVDRRGPGVTREQAAANFSDYVKRSFAVLSGDLDRELGDAQAAEDAGEAPHSPGPNGYIVQTSPLLSYLFRCNVNVQVLSCGLTARIAAFYAADYLGKGGDQMSHLLTLMVRGRLHQQRYPSVAVDESEAAYLRDCIYFIEHLLMKLNGSRDVAVTTACLKLLNHSSEDMSHSLWYLFADQAVAFVLANRAARSGGQQGRPTDAQQSSSSLDAASVNRQPANVVSATELTRELADELAAASVNELEGDSTPAGITDAPTASFEKRAGKPGVLVNALDDYLHRPSELEGFSLYEFCGMIRRRQMTPKELAAACKADAAAAAKAAAAATRDAQGDDVSSVSESDDDSDSASGLPRRRTGRKCSVIFRLRSGHPLAATDILYISSKEFVPLLVGGPSPVFPGVQPACPVDDPVYVSWQAAADRFGAYWRIIAEPWVDDCGPAGPLNYDAFAAWFAAGFPADVSALPPDEPAPAWYYYVERCRREAVRDLAHGLRFRKADKHATRSTAARTTDVWSVDQRLQAAAAAEGEEAAAAESAAAALAASLLLDPLHATDGPGSVSGERAAQALKHSRLLDIMRGLVSRRGPFPTLGLPVAEQAAQVVYHAEAQARSVWAATQRPRMQELPTHSGAAAGSDSRSLPGLPQSPAARREFYLQRVRDETPPPEHKLTVQQAVVFVKVVRFHNAVMRHRADPLTCAMPAQLLLACLAPAGLGKSYVANVLQHVLPSGALCFIAPTGVASSLLPNGMTIHSLLGMNRGSSAAMYSAVPDKPSQANIQGICYHLGPTPSVIVLDEASMVPEQLGATLELRLAAAASQSSWGVADMPFGGLGMLWFGDFHQIEPVAGTFLPKAVCRDQGFGQLFRKFEIMILQGACTHVR
jgi:hypothetical protein